jgi:hypothetical protein
VNRKILPSINEVVDDCALPNEPVLSDAEAAYRRGFHQGAWVALNAARTGASWPDLMTWVNKRLAAWRRETHHVRKGVTITAVWPPRAPEPKEPIA